MKGTVLKFVVSGSSYQDTDEVLVWFKDKLITSVQDRIFDDWERVHDEHANSNDYLDTEEQYIQEALVGYVGEWEFVQTDAERVY